MNQDNDSILYQLWVTHPNGISFASTTAESVQDLFESIQDWFTPGEPFQVMHGKQSFIRESPAAKAVEIRTIRKSRHEAQRAADAAAAERLLPEFLKAK